MRGIGIRPSTSRKLQQKQVSKASPLYISIAGLSYLKEQQQQRRQEPKEETFYRIIRPEDRKQKETTK